MVLLGNDEVSVLKISPTPYSICQLIKLVSFQFLSKLTKMFQNARSSSSVTLTMKRCKLVLSDFFIYHF